MGVVYKALDPFIERIVAVKTMSADLDADPEVRARFYREARSAGQLSHKNIVTIFDLGEEGGKAYMVMEFLDGEDLKNIIGRRKQLPLERKVQFMRELLEGLGHAHKRQVIHRDIKPGNLHITRAGQLKILDFGLARISSSDITRTGSVMGTPNYMSPEQIRSEAVDHRSDIFSAGATFYELLTYRKPFYSSSLPSTFFKILQQDPEPVEAVDSDIPPEFTPVVMKAVAKDPEKRYQSVEEMLRDLERLASLLQERERFLRVEAEQAVTDLDRLVEDNVAVLGEDEIRKLRRSGLMPAGPASQQDPDSTSIGAPEGGFLEALSLRNRARAEYAQLQQLAEQRRKTAALFKQALDQERAGEYEAALKTCQLVLASDDAHQDAAALKGRVRQALLDRAATEAREAVARVEHLIAENPFLRDKVVPARAVPASVDPDRTIEEDAVYHEMIEVRDHARRECERIGGLLESRRRLDRMLRHAVELEQRGGLAESLAEIQNVLAEEPDDSEALSAQARVRQRLQEQERRLLAAREADQLYARARSHFDASEFEKALELLEAALALAPKHVHAAELHSRTGKRLQEKAELERQTRLAAEALEEGNAALQEGDVARARKRLSAALALDSRVNGAAFLAGRIARFEDELQARRERRARARAFEEAVRRALLAGDDIEGRRQLASLLEVDPGHDAVEELRTAVERARAERETREQELRQRIQSALARGIQAHSAGDLETAIRLAGSVLAEDAAHPEAADLLQRAQRDLKLRRQQDELDRLVRETLQRAGGLAEEGRLRDAIAVLDGADPKVAAAPAVSAMLQEYAENVRREDEARAQAERQKRERVAAAVAAGNSALKQLDFQGAVECAQAALTEDPESPDAHALIRSAGRELEARRKREELERKAAELIQDAEILVARNDLASAVALLNTADEDVASLEPVRQASRRHGSALKEQREAEEKSRALVQHWDEASLEFERGDMGSCLRALDLVLAIDPGHQGALALKPRAETISAERRAEEERRRCVADAVREAGQELGARRFEAARRAVGKLSELAPDNPDAARLLSELDRLEAEAAERARREQDATERMATATELLSRGDVEEASRALDGAVAVWPEAPGAVKLRARIEKQARAVRRAAAPPSRRKVLPYAGFGVAGALAVFGFVYLKSGASKAPSRTEIQQPAQTQPSPPRLGSQQVAVNHGLQAPAAAPERGEKEKEKADSALAAQVARRNREARRLYDAGRYDAAMKAVSEVLSIAPDDREAGKLLVRLEQYAEKGAETARGFMAEARSRAETAKAPSLAAQSWSDAQGVEADAGRLFQGRQFGPAAAKMYDAVNLYRAAETDAVEAARAAEQERQRAADRADAERSRQGFEQARSKAAAAGAERKASDSFRSANQLADQARAKLEGGDLRGARSGYEAATETMLRAGEAAGSDQKEWDALRNSRDTAALLAFARKYPGGPLAGQAQRRVEQLDWDAVDRKDPAALRAFLQKHADGAYARQAESELAKIQQADSAGADRQAIRQALSRYAAAYDQMDPQALQDAWPGIPRDTLSTISQSFKNARSTRMELRPLEEPAISGDTALVPCQRLISQTFDRKPHRGAGPDHDTAATPGRGVGYRLYSVTTGA